MPPLKLLHLDFELVLRPPIEPTGQIGHSLHEARAQPIESSTVRLAISSRATFLQYVRCVCLSPLRPCSQCRSSCPYPCEACRTRLPRSHPCTGWTKNAF